MASLAATFGRGAMTNHWKDIKNADVVLVMGANPAENHPCGFKWALEARDEMWRTLGQNEEFQRIIVAAEQDPSRKLAAEINARMLVPTSYSALK